MKSEYIFPLEMYYYEYSTATFLANHRNNIESEEQWDAIREICLLHRENNLSMYGFQSAWNSLEKSSVQIFQPMFSFFTKSDELAKSSRYIFATRPS